MKLSRGQYHGYWMVAAEGGGALPFAEAGGLSLAGFWSWGHVIGGGDVGWFARDERR